MEYVYEYQFEKDRVHDYSDEFFEILVENLLVGLIL